MSTRKAPTSARRANNGATKSRIRVTVRVRPPIGEDVEFAQLQPGFEYEECLEEDSGTGRIALMKPFFDTREFALDTVLDRNATQAMTYTAVGEPVVEDVLRGFNGTILAYGQTGTGKTYTIYGPLSYWRRTPLPASPASPTCRPQLPYQPQLELSGIVTRAALQIFARIGELQREAGAERRRFRVTLSSLQIWQEQISDLLGERTATSSLQARPAGLRACPPPAPSPSLPLPLPSPAPSLPSLAPTHHRPLPHRRRRRSRRP